MHEFNLVTASNVFLFHASLHTRHIRALMTWAKVIYNIVYTHHCVKYSRWFTHSEKYFSVKQWIHAWLVFTPKQNNLCLLKLMKHFKAFNFVCQYMQLISCFFLVDHCKVQRALTRSQKLSVKPRLH